MTRRCRLRSRRRRLGPAAFNHPRQHHSHSATIRCRCVGSVLLLQLQQRLRRATPVRAGLGAGIGAVAEMLYGIQPEPSGAS
jgi:hypothetical protein